MPFEIIFDMDNIEIYDKTFYDTVKCETFSVTDFAIVLFLQQTNNKWVHKVTMKTFENLMQSFFSQPVELSLARRRARLFSVMKVSFENQSSCVSFFE
jgi:hypothetical protein